MPVYDPENSPQENLDLLAENEYPGRLLVVGLAGPVAVQGYALMGRSTDSRNRNLIEEDGIISTESDDMSIPVKRPDLTIYDAMRRTGTSHIVSNGDQTSTAIQHLRAGSTFENAMEARSHEDDEPNFTPRITGLVDIAPHGDEPAFAISINRTSGKDLYTFEEEDFDRAGYDQQIGFAAQTYARNAESGQPLPSYEDAPFMLPIVPSANAMARLLWEHIDPENRVAVAAKTINMSTNAVELSVINASQENALALGDPA